MDPTPNISPNFLSSPSPNITKQAIDFAAADLPEYSNYYACILDNVLSASECSTLIHAVEAQTNGEWHQATINSGFNGQEVDPEARVCGRIIWPNEDLAAKIWERCKGHVPEICEVNAEKVPHITGGSLLMKGWRFKAVGLNEGMRFLRYFDGNYFRRMLVLPSVNFSYLLSASTESDEMLQRISTGRTGRRKVRSRSLRSTYTSTRRMRTPCWRVARQHSMGWIGAVDIWMWCPRLGESFCFSRRDCCIRELM